MEQTLFINRDDYSGNIWDARPSLVPTPGQLAQWGEPRTPDVPFWPCGKCRFLASSRTTFLPMIFFVLFISLVGLTDILEARV